MRSIIIGEPADPHVQAVTAHLDDDDVLVIDASSLPSQTYLLSHDRLRVATRDRNEFLSTEGTRGWIRRLAPADWGVGQVAGSHGAVVQAAVVSLLAGVARVPSITWLTDLDPLLIGESKLVQIQAAAKLGIDTPRTIVTNSRDLAEAELGPVVVIKALGPGHFTISGKDSAVVYATPVDLRDPAFADLGPAPFLLQERIEALTHLRVVTVGSEWWVAALDASGRPLDWRAEASAHHSFQIPTDVPREISSSAPALAKSLRLGYSSQDWIVTSDGRLVLLDVNPAGQWLFLPEPIPSEASRAIARWLSRE